jgi:hypothetical protein
VCVCVCVCGCVYRASGLLEPKQEFDQEEEGAGVGVRVVPGTPWLPGAHPARGEGGVGVGGGSSGEIPPRKKRKRDKRPKDRYAGEGGGEGRGGQEELDECDLDGVPGYEVLLPPEGECQ